MIIRPRTSSQSAMKRNCRKFAIKAPPTLGVYQRHADASVLVVGRVGGMVMRPLAEEPATDPDDRRTLLHGDLEVVGHAHR